MSDITIYYNRDIYAGWPANIGSWSWGNELLCGWTEGRYYTQLSMHHCAEPFAVKFARSKDGGKTWQTEKPNIDFSREPALSADNINWDHPDFTMRAYGEIDHFVCSDANAGAYCVSYDRGRNWNGPFVLMAPDDTYYCTARTAYLKESGLIFISEAEEGTFGRDTTYVARMEDGRAIKLSCLLADKSRSVMPSVISVRGIIFAALRRMEFTDNRCWIEVVESVDNGRTWNSLGVVAETGGVRTNGNPPALSVDKNGQLIVAYGLRERGLMCLKRSKDLGNNWESEEIIRDNFYSELSGYGDFGYPVLLKNKADDLLCVYYWATEERPQQHIVGTWVN